MADGTTLTIKRTIAVRAVVTPAWKEEAERELSNAISTTDQQLAQLEQEGQQVIDEVRRQSANPLDPRVQEQVAQVQQQVAAKRAELEEQKRNLLQQQAQVREVEMEQIVEQGQIESFCDLSVGDNLVSKMQVAAKRAELEEQKRNLLQQQSQVREVEMEQIVDQGQLESFFDIKVGDNLVSKMQVAVVVRDGVVQSIEQG